jgi:hypothetical protein
LHITVERFNKWAKTAKHGDIVTYHVGPTCTGPSGDRLNGAVTAAWVASLKKMVVLTQKRVGPGLFEYKAQRVIPGRQNPRRSHV